MTGFSVKFAECLQRKKLAEFMSKAIIYEDNDKLVRGGKSK